MYKAAGAQGGETPPPGAGPEAAGGQAPQGEKKDDVVDAEFRTN